MSDNSISDKITPIYFGKRADFHWVGFCSGAGSNLLACYRKIKPVLLFSDMPNAPFLELDELKGIPSFTLNGNEICGSWKEAKRNPDSKAEYVKKSIEYNQQILDELRKFEREQKITIDLIILGGYMRIVMDPLLSAFKDKIINVHPADLSILDANGNRRFIGANAVYEAIRKGITSTRSSVIIVDGGIDRGEILVQGPVVPVDAPSGLDKVTEDEFKEFAKEHYTKEFVKEHQKIQKEKSDWPALTKALELTADRRLALGTQKNHFDQWRTVYVNGKPMPYSGFEVKDE